MDTTTDKATYEQEISAFYKNVLRLMSTPPPAGAPENAPTLYPPDQPPDLMVFLGEPDISQIMAVRTQLPHAAFLLWLYPPCEPAVIEKIKHAISSNQRTLLCRAESSSFYDDKLSMLVTMLPEKQVRFVVGKGYTKTHQSTAVKIENSIKQAIENSVNNMTRGLVRLRCSIHNIPGIAANIGNRPILRKSGIPAIICGAGPSLESQFDLLRSVAGRALIIAVGHAAPGMLKAGINPDIIAESDSQASRNWPEDIKHLDSILLANTEVSPEVAARFDKILWCAGSSPPFNILMQKWKVELLEVQLARTVTVSAIDFAVRLGVSTIALVGQDLCLGESGRTHVSQSIAVQPEELMELPGNDGKPVLTTVDLSFLKQSLQDYIKNIDGTPLQNKPAIFNCTKGGALIEGVKRSTIEAFTAQLPERSEKTDLIINAGSPINIQEKTRAFSVAMTKYRTTADNIVKCCTQLKQELAQRQLKMGRVRTQQQQLQQLMALEASIRSSEDAAPVINPLAQYVDNIMKETPGMVSDENDPAVQLSFLSARFSFARDISDDILTDLTHVLDAFKQRSSGTQAPHPHVFKSFKQHALETINQSNPELASALSTFPSGTTPEKFKITWVNQILPFVEKVMDDGTLQPLSTFFTMHDEAKRDIDSFFAPSGFNKKTQAVVFLAPGNWIHPFTFAGAHPEARMMILDPWPELLSAMIERGCFLHKMPKHALIIGVHPKAPRWRSLCANKLDEWRKQDLEIKLFVPPLAAEFNEVAALLNTIKTMDR